MPNIGGRVAIRRAYQELKVSTAEATLAPTVQARIRGQSLISVTSARHTDSRGSVSAHIGVRPTTSRALMKASSAPDGPGGVE
jgi:hypothetical protein